MIKGVTTDALLHSGCRYSLHCGETCAAHFSAQAKSDLLYTTIFNSLAFEITSGNGSLNFLGERVIQSQLPDKGELPEVSMCVFKPAICSSLVNSVRSCIKGSPPVITTIFTGFFFTSDNKNSIDLKGCLPPSQLSFTSHQTQPTSQPPRRIKYAAFPW